MSSNFLSNFRSPSLFFWLGLVGLLIGLAAGCGSAKQEPIEGHITLDGKPLAGVQVLFDQPELSAGGSFAGRTNADGRYVLLFVGGPNAVDKNVEGKYRVTLTTAVPDRNATEHDPLPRELIPKRYCDGSLQFEVPAGGTDKADFQLTK